MQRMLEFDLSPATLMAGMIASSVGFGLFVYGKKSERPPHLLAGLALMGFPMILHGASTVLGVSGLVLVGLWTSVRCGA